MRGSEDLIRARALAEAAIDSATEADAVFVRVGCQPEEARVVATGRALAMLEVLLEPTASTASDVELLALMPHAESAWLNGLLVGLYLAGLVIDTGMEDGALAVTVLSSNGLGEQSPAVALRNLDLDPEAAEAAAASVGADLVQTRDDATGLAAGLASLWLDGLMVATQARRGRR